MKTHWFPLIRPAIRAGYFLVENVALGGVPLDCHEITHEPQKKTSYFPLYWLFNTDPSL